MIKIGQGIDTHPFEKNRPLVLGGVTIPHTHGLKGHSDADALIHAICDAMLGALAKGDIGMYFSDTDVENKNRNSLEFLNIINQMVIAEGWSIGNIDTTIVTEKPKLRPYIEKMQTTLAQILNVQNNCISIKATRPEKLGSLGRGEGLTCHAIVLINKKL